MQAGKLTERQRTTLEHLKQAQELGSSLSDYAAAFNLNLKDLYNGRTQLQRKGLWPRTRGAQRSGWKLLAVQVARRRAADCPWARERFICYMHVAYICPTCAVLRESSVTRPQASSEVMRRDGRLCCEPARAVGYDHPDVVVVEYVARAPSDRADSRVLILLQESQHRTDGLRG